MPQRTEPFDVNRHSHSRRMNAIVLAAGKGSRMRSPLPKPLQPVNGQPMVSYVVDAIAGLGVDRMIVVVGHQGSLVRDTLRGVFSGDKSLEFVEQKKYLQKWSSSSLLIPSQLMAALKTLYGFSYFERPDVLQAIGMPPFCNI